MDTTSVYGPAFTAGVRAGGRGRGRLGRRRAPGRSRHSPPPPRSRPRSSPARLARRRAFAIALVGWNPLLAVHLAGGGHNDAWVGALILAALALSASRRAAERRRALGRSRSRSSGCRSSSSLSGRSRRARRGRAARRHRGLARHGGCRGRSARRVLYGGAWPLARSSRSAGNAALETSYAIPHRLEQLGVPDGVALGARRRGVRRRVRLARARGAPRQGAARPGGLPGARDDAVSRRLVPGLGGSAGRGRGGRDGHGRRASLLCAYLLPQTIPV